MRSTDGKVSSSNEYMQLRSNDVKVFGLYLEM